MPRSIRTFNDALQTASASDLALLEPLTQIEDELALDDVMKSLPIDPIAWDDDEDEDDDDDLLEDEEDLDIGDDEDEDFFEDDEEFDDEDDEEFDDDDDE